MTIENQQHYVLSTITPRAICDINGNDYYFYASRRDLMLEVGYMSSLYAQCHLLIVSFKNKYGQRIMLRKRLIFQTLKATMIMWSDYSNKFFI